MGICVFVQALWFAASSRIGIPGLEAAKFGVVVASSQIIEPRVQIVLFAGVEIAVFRGGCRGNEVAECVISISVGQ
jgi:hypothetical protein